MPEAEYNPYNFVPLDNDKSVEREPHPGLHRLPETTWSGKIVCTLRVAENSRLFTADQVHAGKPTDGSDEQRKKFEFLRNAGGTPILQASTLKGMVRAVYEARTNSCLPLVATEGTGRPTRYKFEALKAHDPTKCKNRDKLCPACRLFGVIRGDELHAQGRVFFSDGELCEGQLVEDTVNLKELSSPKPHHYPIYSATRASGGPIAGRKFYYHFPVKKGEEQLGQRSHQIVEYAGGNCSFRFTVRFQGLCKQELANLVACLVLEDNLGHKLGLAKPLGYGSCRIRIDAGASAVYKGGSRYQKWGSKAKSPDVDELTQQASPLPEALRKLLQLNFHSDHSVGYRSYRGYERIGIDSDGKFFSIGGASTPSATSPGSPGKGRARGRGRRREAREARTSSGSRHPSPPGPSRSHGGGAPQPAAANLGELVGKAGKTPSRAGSRGIHVGDKVKVEVVDHGERAYRLKVLSTGQDDLYYAGEVPWKAGQRLKVRVVKIRPDGKVGEIRP